MDHTTWWLEYSVCKKFSVHFFIYFFCERGEETWLVVVGAGSVLRKIQFGFFRIFFDVNTKLNYFPFHIWSLFISCYLFVDLFVESFC